MYNEITKNNDDDGSYDYLLKMPIYNLTFEKMEEFNNNLNDLIQKSKDLKSKTYHNLWDDDINSLNIIDKIVKKKVSNCK